MSEENLDVLMEVPFTFQRRPTPIPADMRPLRRIALLLFMLEKCQGGKASHEQLHVLNWALKSSESQKALLEFMRGDGHPDKPIVRFDPTLDRATMFAEAEGFVSIELVGSPRGERTDGKWPGYRVGLTSSGREIVKELAEISDCFKPEREFLAQMGRKFTQTRIRSLFNWEFQ